ncbi:MAG: hypothetical protein K2N38_12690 [Oscillospiraceae bacterium]|nr:hypothetical protein [Oscillospiraceae bacterium]
MRKRLLGVILAVGAALALCGCSGDKATVNGNTASVRSAGVGVTFPEDWKIITGDAIYDITYSRNPDGYESAEALKKDIEGSGERYIVYAESPEENALALLSSQPLEDSVNEELTAESLARGIHDDTVFEYRLNGYYTESSLSEEEMGGVSGWLSVIKVYEEYGGEALSEQREFMFERMKTVYSLRFFSQGFIDEQVQNISISAI